MREIQLALYEIDKETMMELYLKLQEQVFKLNNLTKHLDGAQIWCKQVSKANGGAHKIYNATVHCLIAKKAGKVLWRDL